MFIFLRLKTFFRAVIEISDDDLCVFLILALEYLIEWLLVVLLKRVKLSCHDLRLGLTVSCTDLIKRSLSQTSDTSDVNKLGLALVSVLTDLCEWSLNNTFSNIN